MSGLPAWSTAAFAPRCIASKLGALRLLVEHLGLTKRATVGVDVNIRARLNAALARIEAADALALADAMEALVGPANDRQLQDGMEIERVFSGACVRQAPASLPCALPKLITSAIISVCSS